MYKKIIYLALSFLLMNGIIAQKEETIFSAKNVDNNAKLLYKSGIVTEDKAEVLSITGFGTNVSFTASNVGDGTSNSFNHIQRVSLPLLVAGGKPANVQLVFYSPGEKIPFTVVATEGAVTVYYLIDLYDDIKKRLTDAFAARKKVQLKVDLKKDGFREAVLTF
jgi:hypothetical protein